MHRLFGHFEYVDLDPIVIKDTYRDNKFSSAYDLENDLITTNLAAVPIRS